MDSADSKPLPSVVAEAFEALRAKPDRGRTWADREAVLAQPRRVAPLAAAGTSAVLNSAFSAVSQLKPGQQVKRGSATFELVSDDGAGKTHVLVTHDTAGTWSVARSTAPALNHFAIRQRNGDDSRIVSSGSWSAGADGRLNVGQHNHDPANFVALSRLAVLVSEGGPRAKPRTFHRSDATAAVLEADGGIPAANSRALFRALSEDAAVRVLSWGAPLFDATARMFSAEGLRWGQEALAWSLNVSARFPSEGGRTNTACLLPREGRMTVAAVFRRAQPNLETETYLVWRELPHEGGHGTIHLLPVDQEAMDDIETFIRSGAVPAVSYTPSSNALRMTERAISSGVVECFANQIGEAWSALSDLPLYAPQGERPMVTDDFSTFDRIEPWTRRGRALGAAKALAGHAAPAP